MRLLTYLRTRYLGFLLGADFPRRARKHCEAEGPTTNDARRLLAEVSPAPHVDGLDPVDRNHALLVLLNRDGWYLPDFAWHEWDPPRPYLKQPDALAEAPLEDLRKVWVTLWRQDYHASSDGNSVLTWAFEAGVIAALLARTQALLDAGEFPPTTLGRRWRRWLAGLETLDRLSSRPVPWEDRPRTRLGIVHDLLGSLLGLDPAGFLTALPEPWDARVLRSLVIIALLGVVLSLGWIAWWIVSGWL